jgi:cytochrome b pre-mRNA-processing protein 3
MFAWIRERKNLRSSVQLIYASVVAQARQPAFYRHLGVPDSLEGRYEMITLHLFLILERLREEGPQCQRPARALVERFVTDMDDCMRELGVGDLTVPKKVKRAAAGIFERTSAYRTALESGEDALARAIAANLAGAENVDLSENHRSLAAYVMASTRQLAAEPSEVIFSNGARFAPLDAFLKEKSA